MLNLEIKILSNSTETFLRQTLIKILDIIKIFVKNNLLCSHISLI